MAEYENTKLNIKLVTVELTQGVLEKYLDRLQGKQNMPVGKYYAEMLRAGIEVGWVVEPDWTPEQVANQKPVVIRWLGDKLNALYLLETTVPPE